MTDKKRIQEITQQIREILMRDWDPIGVPNLPADEYDMYIGSIYGLIVRGASVDEIEHTSVQLKWSALNLSFRIRNERKLQIL